MPVLFLSWDSGVRCEHRFSLILPAPRWPLHAHLLLFWFAWDASTLRAESPPGWEDAARVVKIPGWPLQHIAAGAKGDWGINAGIKSILNQAGEVAQRLRHLPCRLNPVPYLGSLKHYQEWFLSIELGASPNTTRFQSPHTPFPVCCEKSKWFLFKHQKKKTEKVIVSEL